MFLFISRSSPHARDITTMKYLLTVVSLNEQVSKFIASLGYEVITPEQLNEDNASQIEVIMSNGTGIVTKELLDKLPQVKMIDNFGVGYDGVDIAECKRRNIALCTTPGVLTEDVADLAMGLMLSLSRRITQSHNFIHANLWEKGAKFPLGTKVSGKKVGIFGLGRIGSAVAARCQGFNMEVHYYDRVAKPTSYIKANSLEDLAAQVDYLVVCAAATQENHKIINAAVLQALGAQGMLINIARGSLVDEQALCQALEQGVIKGAALDVFACEPYVPQALLNQDNVVLSSHIASATVETRKQMADIVNANLAAFVAGQELPTKLAW